MKTTSCESNRTEEPAYDGYYKYDANIARDYDTSREKEVHWWREDQFIEAYFNKRQINSLLDLPVGTGRFFIHYHNVRNLVGVDISKAMLEEAREKLVFLSSETSVRLECGDVFSLRFTDNEFEVTLVCRLFHLIPQHMVAKAIRELCRVTKGEIIVQTYTLTKAARISLWRSRLKNKAFRSLHKIFPGLFYKKATESNAPLKPWSHIQAFYHQQSFLDSLFNNCGFYVLRRKILDKYEGTHVKFTIYSNER
ncbi:MAG TPA: class I SAM-dependent methyltransferase [Blastocatellia bacterium]|nr:class I SAM-dependent methyltransferase [Blastocatellia bacterium]